MIPTSRIGVLLFRLALFSGLVFLVFDPTESLSFDLRFTYKEVQSHSISPPSVDEVDLRIIVLTQKRSESLKRCLASIAGALYDNATVALDIWVDRYINDLPVDQDTVAVAENFSWPYGHKTVHKRERVMGLAHQWINTWHESLPGGLSTLIKERVLILEDDMAVSKFYWRWLQAAHDAYDGRSDIAGVTLQRATLCAAHCPDLQGGPVASGVFLYPLLGSWGYSPSVQHWVKFRRWANVALEMRSDIRVPGLKPTDWYNSKLESGLCPGVKCMWTMLHVKYTHSHEDSYTVYLRAPHGRTMGSNWKEPGMNYKRLLVTRWDSNSMAHFPTTPLMIGWNGILKMSFVEYATQIAHAEGVVSVQFFNQAFVPMVKHFICNANQVGGGILTKTLFVATDRDAYVNISQFQNDLHVAYEQQPSQKLLKYGTVDYYRLVLWRTGKINELVQAGVNLLLSEPDAVWFQAPFEKFDSETYHEADVLVFDDHPPKMVLNGGFILLRNTSATRKAWSEIYERHAAYLAPYLDSPGSQDIKRKGDEQRLMTDVFAAQKKLRVDWLSQDIITSGSWYESHQNSTGIILFNWVVGMDAKVRRAKKYNHWFYNLENDTCIVYA